MNAFEQIRVARRFQRAIRIDRDANDLSAVLDYVPLRSACDALRRMGEQVASSRQRAFTWTGPYGGGKSSLALILGALLSRNKKIRQAAVQVIGLSDAKGIQKRFSLGKKGWLVIPVVGYSADPLTAIASAVDQALRQHLGRKLPAQLARPTDVRNPRALIEKLEFAARVCERQGDGLLLIIDEMGKLLEHAAANARDVYFFQELAERAARLEAKLVVVGILHQAFEQYAVRLSRDARDEWAKIQGRFVDIPLATGFDEVIDLIGRALVGAKPPRDHLDLAAAVAGSVSARRPGRASDLASALSRCWPLHPVVAGLLAAISRRRFGQNERSTFGFLCSGEPGGFQDFLRSATERKLDLYEPCQLWDYLRLNLEPAILASPDAHRWSEAVEAVDRTKARGLDSHQKLAKAIALIDMFGSVVGITADEATLQTCLPNDTKGALEDALRQLREWSVAVYRNHLRSWALFAGSDFDIDAAVAAARSRTTQVDFSRLQAIASQQPVLAKRHYYNSGTLRWFETRIAPLSEGNAAVEKFDPTVGASGVFVLLIPTDGEGAASAQSRCSDLSRYPGQCPFAVGLAADSLLIRDLSLELSALESIRAGETTLEGDAVARRELAGRISSISFQLDGLMREAVGSATWYLNGQAVGVLGTAGVSKLASELADRAFLKTPILRNELINRTRPSANAVAATRILMHRMVSDGTKPHLGIEGFPAERGLYASVLYASGIHREDRDNPGLFRFHRPKGRTQSASFQDLWEEGERFLRTAETEKVSLAQLYEVWAKPPFGLRLGVVPVLALSLLLAKESELAIYLDGTFVPRLDDFFVDRLLQSPEAIAVRRFDLAGVRRATLERIASLVEDTTHRRIPLEALAIAKPLVAFVRALHPWVRRTRSLAPRTLHVRDELLRADDPYKLLFEQLPQACEVSLASGEERSSADLFQDALSHALHELRLAYPRMLETIRSRILTQLGEAEDNADARFRIAERAGTIVGLSGDFRLDSFATRLKKIDGSTEWIEGVAGLAANKPARDWTDSDVDSATLEIADLSSRFRRAETLARALGRPEGSQSIAIVVGAGSQTEAFMTTFDVGARDQGKIADAVRKLRQTLEGDGVGRELILAALAELGRQLITEAKGREPQASGPPAGLSDAGKGPSWRN